MTDFEKKECKVIGSRFEPGDYQVIQGIKGNQNYRGWSNGSYVEVHNGVKKIITPTKHYVTCTDSEGKNYDVDVTSAAHRNGEKRWDIKKAIAFFCNAFLNGVSILCPQNSNRAFLSDDSFKENTTEPPEFGISDLDSKNPYFDDDQYCDFK